MLRLPHGGGGQLVTQCAQTALSLSARVYELRPHMKPAKGLIPRTAFYILFQP